MDKKMQKIGVLMMVFCFSLGLISCESKAEKEERAKTAHQKKMSEKFRNGGIPIIRFSEEDVALFAKAKNEGNEKVQWKIYKKYGVTKKTIDEVIIIGNEEI